MANYGSARDLTLSNLADEYARRGLGTLSDAQLIDEVAAVLSEPKVEPADSFVLHAPLELLARAALLRYLPPAARPRARMRLAALAAEYQAAGAPAQQGVERTAGSRGDSLAETATRLGAAIAGGEFDDIDAAADRLGQVATPTQLCRLLAEDLLPRLAAAGHAPIFLFAYPRIVPQGGACGRMLRGLARELGRNPQARITWFTNTESVPPAAQQLLDLLIDVPAYGRPEVFFIEPTMRQVDANADARRRLHGATRGPIDIAAARTVLQRVAAWSMLQEPPDQAPYGWTHCLTMPQAVLGLQTFCRDPALALEVAATHVLGFRNAIGTVKLAPGYEPADPPATSNLTEALAGSPTAAASAVYHAPASDQAQVIARLATSASLQHDAHLVKYVLACLDAAGEDPGARRLYLAAAASLVAWWNQHPDESDPLPPGAGA